jgi:N-acetylglucosaminyldiphosphoundecaprenol N-acetyl-beta-D-mannosaminyltransferase
MGSEMNSRTIKLGGLTIDAVTEAEAIAHVLGELRAGRGGRLGTLNTDIFRAATRHPEMNRLITGSSLLVADGMPVVWAAKLQGTPLPERVTGASLVMSLSGAAAQEGRSVYLLGGGPPGVPEQARDALCSRNPTLVVAGVDAPPQGFDCSEAGVDAVCDRVLSAAPDIVYVGLGFPKQERLIARLAPLAPSSWFLGCGAAISFAAGAASRAPRWMQQVGMEWFYRLAREPRRLARRYLIDDLPFAGSLIASRIVQRFGSRGEDLPMIGFPAAVEHGASVVRELYGYNGPGVTAVESVSEPPVLAQGLGSAGFGINHSGD